MQCKVQVTLVQALRFCTGRTAHRGSRCIALLFLDHGTRRGWGVSVTPWPLFTPWKDPVPIVQEAGWAPGPVWTGAENFAPTGIRSPDRPARSQSLYRLSYPAHFNAIWRAPILKLGLIFRNFYHLWGSEPLNLSYSQKIHAFYGTQTFVTLLTRFLHFSPIWAR